MKTALTNINPIRRFTASQAGNPVTRDEFDELSEKVDGILSEMDAVFSPDNLKAAIGEAIKPLMEELDAKAAPVPATNRRNVPGAFQLPKSEQPTSSKVAPGFTLPKAEG
ncbi:hypothetical protein [Croceicoccus naphthovorans]|uniref:Uncharacterized protein n=1 Tax=Croceicoccus naphthovorans TaxID=1348774 RepID=A0A0G3XFC2_9SPHN|nr:hypothetical protein [Croceicoccus naphthovorans]AKM09314.1 hypothetical protein AB433_03885 [Croceicoccus naphthovorans]MBB3990220.1 hypothetical protein [Croceicoccus naphthovorans]